MFEERVDDRLYLVGICPFGLKNQSRLCVDYECGVGYFAVCGQSFLID